MSTNTHQGAEGAETMTAGTKALSARALAGMLRSRIERAAEHKSETVSLGQFFADQIHRYLTEAGHGPEHDARSGDVPADGGDPDCDRSRDWGLRARQVHLGALSKRAAGGKWFASTNGADGLARLDNGTDGMFPVRGEWHEIEFIEALVNAYRHGDLATPAPRTDGGMTAGEDHAWTFERTRTYLLAELERLRADLHTIGEDLTGEQGKAASWLDVATGRVANVSSVLASATPAQPAGAVPDGLREAFEAAELQECWVNGDTADVMTNPYGHCGNFDQIVARCATGDLWRKRAVAIAESLNFVRTLLAFHPAGQSAGSGAETDALVDRFSAALKVKLRAAEAKYGWKNGWLKSNWQVECQNGLLRHVGKGDPLDVAAYAAFCWHHGWPSASRRSTDFVTGAVIPTAGAIAAYETRYPEGSLSETSDNAIEAWNRVAAAVCLAEKPAPDSTRTDQGEAEELREEVAYWRRDLSARIWAMTAHYKGALERGEGTRASEIGNDLRAALASFHDAQAKDWYERCDICGEHIRDGEPTAASEDVSGHARCLSEDGEGAVYPHGEEDLAAQVRAAQAALAEPWPEVALAARPAAPEALVEALARTLDPKVWERHDAVLRRYQGRWTYNAQDSAYYADAIAGTQDARAASLSAARACVDGPLAPTLAALATVTAEAASLRAEGEAKDRRIATLTEALAPFARFGDMATPDTAETWAGVHHTFRIGTRFKHEHFRAARAATAREGA